jgi:hypothetical protein
MIGIVYKLYRVGLDDFYIGSSFDIEKRKRKHKSDCNNPNSKGYNLKVYQYIRANGGYEKWKFEILVEKEFENKTALKIREQECIKLLNPSLNSNNAYRTKEERKIQQKAFNDKRLTIKCACGGKTSKEYKSTHEKTKKHQKYLKTINNITNITYNITNLTINK